MRPIQLSLKTNPLDPRGVSLGISDGNGTTGSVEVRRIVDMTGGEPLLDFVHIGPTGPEHLASQHCCRLHLPPGRYSIVFFYRGGAHWLTLQVDRYRNRCRSFLIYLGEGRSIKLEIAV